MEIYSAQAPTPNGIRTVLKNIGKKGKLNTLSTIVKAVLTKTTSHAHFFRTSRPMPAAADKVPRTTSSQPW